MSSFEEQGIKFSIIPEEKYEEAKAFLYKNFFPDEPCCRSLGVALDGSPNYLVDSFFVYDSLKDKSCIMATNKDGNIIGIRFGKVVHASDSTWYWYALKKLFYWIEWITPSSYQYINKMMFFNDKVNYDVYQMFTELGDVIYEGRCVCVSSENRVKGLGTELIRQSMQVARERGCKAMYLMATGMYSQRIFQKLDFRILNEYNYEDLKYDNGEIIIWDSREHTKGQIVCKEL